MVKREPREPEGPPPKQTWASQYVIDSREYPIDPSQPRLPYFSRHDALLCARLKASRDRNAARGMEDRAIARSRSPQ